MKKIVAICLLCICCLAASSTKTEFDVLRDNWAKYVEFMQKGEWENIWEYCLDDYNKGFLAGLKEAVEYKGSVKEFFIEIYAPQTTLANARSWANSRVTNNYILDHDKRCIVITAEDGMLYPFTATRQSKKWKIDPLLTNQEWMSVFAKKYPKNFGLILRKLELSSR